jgi:hypothetical protein
MSTDKKCLFCGGLELGFSGVTCENVLVGIDGEFVCSGCVQLLRTQPREKLINTHQLAVSMGLVGKARAISTFIKEVEEHVPETNRSQKRLQRERPGRGFEPAHQREVRA